MSVLWKDAIRKFIISGNAKELNITLRTDWIGFYPEEKQEIFRFLYLSKQYSLFLLFFSIDLKGNEEELPWLQFLQILAITRTKIPDDNFDEMRKYFIGMKLASKKAFTLAKLIEEIKTNQKNKFYQKLKVKKEELAVSAQIAKSEQLLDQHVQYMNELKKIAPLEYNVSSLISDQEKRNADRVLQRRSNKKVKQNKVIENHRLSDEEKSLIDSIIPQANKYFKKKKAKAEDFAYLFRTLGNNNVAIDFIFKNKESDKKDWQLLDYLFSGKQYVSLLDHCALLKQKYDQYPDALFSIYYAEAIAYWELGEKIKAIEIMEQISSMRPNFKSATETLNQWKEESFE